MVKEHRNHPAIVVWSYCNEYECGQVKNIDISIDIYGALAVGSPSKFLLLILMQISNSEH